MRGTERPSEMWDRLLFRDFLRNHPDAVRRYEAQKWVLAAKHMQDREAYTEAKDDFVRQIIDLARANR